MRGPEAAREVRRGLLTLPTATPASHCPCPTLPLQFQGEWFVLGLAGNSFRPEHRALLNPFTATFELSDDGRFEVWNAMTR